VLEKPRRIGDARGCIVVDEGDTRELVDEIDRQPLIFAHAADLGRRRNLASLKAADHQLGRDRTNRSAATLPYEPVCHAPAPLPPSSRKAACG
jgi:hypothetical protein